MMQMPDGQFDRVARFSVGQDAGWIILQRCWREWLTGIVDGVFDKDAGLPA